MNVEQILAQRKLETLTVNGFAPDVIRADTMAWSGLSAVLGTDVITTWNLKTIEHTYQPADEESGAPEGVVFKAEFVRTPDEEGEES